MTQKKSYLIILIICSACSFEVAEKEADIDGVSCDQVRLGERIQDCRNSPKKDTLHFYTFFQIQKNSSLGVRIAEDSFIDSLRLMNSSQNYLMHSLIHKPPFWILAIQPQENFEGDLSTTVLIHKKINEVSFKEIRHYDFSVVSQF